MCEQICVAYPSYKQFFQDTNRPTSLYFVEQSSTKIISGKGDDKPSKQDNRKLQGTIYFPTIQMLQLSSKGTASNPSLYAYYQKQLLRSKSKPQSLILISRRLIDIIYGTLKNKTGYQMPKTQENCGCKYYSLIHEPDFTGADLSGARFTAAEAYSGVPGYNKWIVTGYQRVSFRNANLSGADFLRSRIRDADFTGAVMDGAVFQRGQLPQYNLSQEQLQVISILG